MLRALTSGLLLTLISLPTGARLPQGVQLDSVRCGRHVVEVGDHAGQVIEACGQPDHRAVVELRQSTVGLRGPEGEVTLQAGVGRVQVVEEWVYRPGSGRLTRIMLVVGGVLTDIRIAGRN